MRYDTPLEDRRKRAERRKARYHADPDFRLKEINRRRARDGAPLISDLSQMADRYAGLRNRRPNAS